MSGAGVLDLWEAGLTMTPAARAVLLLEAAGHPEAADWPVGRRDEVLLRSYCGARGALSAVADCPGCGMSMDVSLDPAQFDAAQLDSAEPDSAGFDPAQPGSSTPRPLGSRTVGSLSVTVDHEDYRLRCRLPTAGDLEGLDPREAVDSQLDQLLSVCILDAARAGVPVGRDDLPDEVVAAVERALEEADPGADLRLNLVCAECGTRWTDQLDPVRFAWTTVEQRARRLATDVHALAAAYGWSEAEIFDLSPFRRHLYLSAVQP